MTEPSSTDLATEQTQRWIERAVIGLNLCPFAAAPWRRDQVRLAASAAVDFDEAIRDALDEAERLLDADPQQLSTTLIIFPHALDDFEEFLEAADTLDALLAQAGAEGVLQVATFHPRYRFDDTDQDAPSNYTNRSPLPVLHLLREDEVSQAIDAHPDPDRIWEQNVARMESLGPDGVAALWAKLIADSE